MNLRTLILTINSCKKAYRNYLKVLFTLYKRRKVTHNQSVNIRILLRDGNSYSVPYGWVVAYAYMIYIESNIINKNISEIKLTEEGLSFTYKGHYVCIDPARFSDPFAVFLYEEYEYLYVKDKEVIDIGMNIGDSVIYFSLNGAKRVIGLEPFPYSFSFAEKNVKLNHISNVILLNAGYGKDSKVFVDADKISSNDSSLVTADKGKEIPILSLKTLINQYNMKNVILKMDCEGCEYALIDEDDEIFNNIEMIQIEYHYGYGNLLDKLKRYGYDVKFTEPRKGFNSIEGNQNSRVGYIYATKIGKKQY